LSLSTGIFVATVYNLVVELHKRVLQNSLYSAKETYNFAKEPFSRIFQ